MHPLTSATEGQAAKFRGYLPRTPQQSSTFRSRRHAIGFAALVVVATIVMALNDQLQVNGQEMFLAACVIVIGAFPMVLFLRRGTFDIVPLLPLHGLFYSVTFGFPAFFGTFQSWTVS